MRLALAPFGPSPKAARALALLNVKYIFAPCSVPLNRRFYQLLYAGAGCVYRVSATMPRAVLVHSVRWATPGRATALLGRGSVDPRHIVLLDPATAGGAAWRLASAPHRPVRDEVRVTHYDLDAVTVNVRSTRDGVLVLADAYARGWQAAIDGRPAPLARANAAFRAVPVGPGAHTVRFTYRPQTFSVGVAVSALACAVWLMLLLGGQPWALSRRLRADRWALIAHGSVMMWPWDTSARQQRTATRRGTGHAVGERRRAGRSCSWHTSCRRRSRRRYEGEVDHGRTQS
jgi:hypothetical protein